MNHAEIVGTMVIVAAGFGAAAIVLFAACWAAGHYAWRLWGELSTIYRLESMQYWFNQMTKNGTHVLRKECIEKQEQQP